MIVKFEQYNESVKSLLVGPTKEEVWSELMNGKLKGLITSIPESPEDFFNQMKEGCIKMGKERYGSSFGKNNVKLFWENGNDYLIVSNKYIWSILENIYGLTHNETKLLIENIIKNDKKWKYLIPAKFHWILGDN